MKTPRCGVVGCRRDRQPHYAFCPDDLERVIAAWLGRPPRFYNAAPTGEYEPLPPAPALPRALTTQGRVPSARLHTAGSRA